MNRTLLTAATVAALTVVVAACGPKPPQPVPQISAVQFVPMPNTPAGIARCNSYPGGAPQRHPSDPSLIVCRIVP